MAIFNSFFYVYQRVMILPFLDKTQEIIRPWDIARKHEDLNMGTWHILECHICPSQLRWFRLIYQGIFLEELKPSTSSRFHFAIGHFFGLCWIFAMFLVERAHSTRFVLYLVSYG